MTATSARRRGVLRVVVRLLLNLWGLARDLVVLPFVVRVPREWIVIRLERGLGDVPRMRSSILSPPAPPSLAEILEGLERARDDGRVEGVLVRVGPGALGWSTTQTLARALGQVRQAGRSVVVYAEATGNAGAWLGAGADAFWMTPEGSLDLIGVSMQSPYLRGALDLFGVRPQVIPAGRYKSAGEIIARDSMSDEAREAADSIVDQLHGALVAGLAEGRQVPAEEARRWIDQGPYLAVEAQEARLVDDLCYADELPARLRGLRRDREGNGSSGDGAEAALISLRRYLAVSRPRLRWRALFRPPEVIAVIPLQGLIGRRLDSPRGFARLLARVAEEPGVRAVVLRVDSPGGDALASDLMWRAVSQLVEKKPVVSSMGDVAASGGYYVAMGANEIVAEKVTLTGSIGVVLAALEIDGVLERLGVKLDGVSRGARAHIHSGLRRRSNDEIEVLRRQVERRYASFCQKVALGRGLEAGDVADRAEGRVWTGAEALERSLVDTLGGLDVAIDRARALAGLSPGQGEVVYLDPRPGPLGRILRRDAPETGAAVPSGVQLLCPIHVPLR